jgi:hypothetical protein
MKSNQIPPRDAGARTRTGRGEKPHPAASAFASSQVLHTRNRASPCLSAAPPPSPPPSPALGTIPPLPLPPRRAPKATPSPPWPWWLLLLLSRHVRYHARAILILAVARSPHPLRFSAAALIRWPPHPWVLDRGGGPRDLGFMPLCRIWPLIRLLPVLSAGGRGDACAPPGGRCRQRRQCPSHGRYRDCPFVLSRLLLCYSLIYGVVWQCAALGSEIVWLANSDS